MTRGESKRETATEKCITINIQMNIKSVTCSKWNECWINTELSALSFYAVIVAAGITILNFKTHTHHTIIFVFVKNVYNIFHMYINFFENNKTFQK